MQKVKSSVTQKEVAKFNDFTINFATSALKSLGKSQLASALTPKNAMSSDLGISG